MEHFLMKLVLVIVILAVAYDMNLRASSWYVGIPSLLVIFGSIGYLIKMLVDLT